MASSTVSYRLERGVAWLTLNNPPVNALSQALRSDLQQSLERAIEDAANLVVIGAQGKTFVAGADIRELGQPPQSPTLPELLRYIEEFSVPIVFSLHGKVLGGGLELAMAGHYRCAIHDTEFGMPEVSLGLIPGAGGTQYLPRLVGCDTALEMILDGLNLDPQRALERGLIDRLVDGHAGVDAWAQELRAIAAPPRRSGERPAEPPANSGLFDQARERAARKYRGQPAASAAIDLIEASLTLPLQAALAEERRRFIACRASPESAAMRHAFFAERAAAKVSGLSADTQERTVETVAILGAGTMGVGIAICFMEAGMDTLLIDADPEALQRGVDRIETHIARQSERGRINDAQAYACRRCLRSSCVIEDVGNAELVIEAVFENLATKLAVFKKLDAVCRPGTILATNTSYLDVNVIADATTRPGDVVGAHFFSPANVMRLLEVVRGELTADDTLKTLLGVSRRISKLPVVVGVCEGFVGNRMLRRYGRQAQNLLLQGVAPQQIDGALEHWGMAMGPLAVSDLAGLDIGYRSRRDEGIEPGARADCAIPDGLVDLGRLGRKSGAGYYRYENGKRNSELDPAVSHLIEEQSRRWQVTPQSLSDAEIVEHMLLALINEAAAIVREGIVERASDVDVVYLNGYGFPRWRGGPLYVADHLGMQQVVDALRALERRYNSKEYRPDALLQKLAEDHQSFADYDARH